MPRPVAVAPAVAAGGHGVRLFNRYELKYLADPQLIGALLPSLRARLDPDPEAGMAEYPVWSLYYDSPDLHCYWEKIDGVRFRRKLRIRHYGAPSSLTPTTPVWVEIKQRVNRVTQKRRTALPYAQAAALCAGEMPDVVGSPSRYFVEEVLSFVATKELRPVSVVGYAREALVGRAEDAGLRVTVDRRVRGRDRDLDLRMESEHRFIIRPDLAVVEIKVNERIPHWITERVAAHGLQLVRVSKYCQSIDAFGRAPRALSQSATESLDAVMHPPEVPSERPSESETAP